MEHEARLQRKKLILVTCFSTSLPLLIFLFGALTVLQQDVVILAVVAAAAAMALAGAVLTGFSQALGTLISLLMGLPGGFVLALLLGGQPALTARGMLLTAAWLLVCVLLGFVVVRLCRKTAARYPALESGTAGRIVLSGNLVMVLGAIALMGYIALRQ